MDESLVLAVVGAGAIGSSVAGWIAPKYDQLVLLARGESSDALRKQGLKFYLKGQQDKTAPFPVKVIESLTEIAPPDIIVLTVKNYDLESTAAALKQQLGSHQPIIVALQNGVENQQILPRHFAKVIYGVVCFNAWRDGPGKVGHQKRGYLILGTPHNDLQTEQQQVAAILKLGMEITLTNRLEDAVHCKLAINTANALVALTGFQEQPMKSFDALTHMSSKLIWEGIQVIKANGYKEHKLGRIPSWKIFRISATLPRTIAGFLYRFIPREDLGLNSTAQDLLAGKANTELESFNGYMLTLARKAKIPTPINEAVYEIAKERFDPIFRPMTAKELLTAISNKLRK